MFIIMFLSQHNKRNKIHSCAFPDHIVILFLISSVGHSRSPVLVLHHGVVLLPLASALRIGGHKAQSKFHLFNMNSSEGSYN